MAVPARCNVAEKVLQYGSVRDAGRSRAGVRKAGLNGKKQQRKSADSVDFWKIISYNYAGMKYSCKELY